MKTDDNLEYQYDQVVAYIKQFQIYSKTHAKRIAFRFLFSPKHVYSISKFITEQITLSSRSSEPLKNTILDLSKDEDKQNEFFQILASDYVTDSLATQIMARFPDFDFEKLKKFHELNKERLARRNIVPIMITTILAISTALLKTVPQSVVKLYIADYTAYEIAVFKFTVFSLIIVIAQFGLIWLNFVAVQNDYVFLADVLTYITIKQGK